MGGVVKKALGKEPVKSAVESMKPAETATKAETEIAMQKQASLRARRGRGGLFARNLGDTQDTLGG